MNDLISRQEAIDVLDKIFPADPMRNDYTQGITCGAALATEYIKQLPSAQPETHDKRTKTHSCDLIDRQAAIEALQEHRNLFCDNTPETFSVLPYGDKCRVDELDMAIATLINLPSAQPVAKDINVPVKDCISRQAAISVIAKWMLEYGGEGEERERNALKQAAEEIKEFPPAQPDLSVYSDKLWKRAYERGKTEAQRKKGHWIRHPEQRNIFNGKTIECSECHEKYTVQYVEDELFCRHCGADMTEGKG